MPKDVQVEYEEKIEIGTKADDGRLGVGRMYINVIKPGSKDSGYTILTQKQAQLLAIALLETITETEA